MNLDTYQYPKAGQLEFAFSTFDTIPALLKEAKERGFYNGNTPANDLFNKWFFGGLDKTPDFKEGAKQPVAQEAMNYAVCLMRSFAPKHEEKEAVCAMLFDHFLATPEPSSK